MNQEEMHGYDRLFVQFIILFNEERDYYQCHDVMEELWLEEGRKPLLQGLLQVAVGLHHFQNGNRSGASKLLEAALYKLYPYPDVIMGIQLGQLREDVEKILQEIKNSEQILPLSFNITIQVVDQELERCMACYEPLTDV